jgi:STE24 endopeptidase
MQEENRGSMNVDSWYSAWHYSHPHVVERLKAIDAAIVSGAKKVL